MKKVPFSTAAPSVSEGLKAELRCSLSLTQQYASAVLLLLLLAFRSKAEKPCRCFNALSQCDCVLRIPGQIGIFQSDSERFQFEDVNVFALSQ